MVPDDAFSYLVTLTSLSTKQKQKQLKCNNATNLVLKLKLEQKVHVTQNREFQFLVKYSTRYTVSCFQFKSTLQIFWGFDNYSATLFFVQNQA